MSQRIDNEPAFILHTRAFKETSVIAELLTEKNGKVSVVARGARGPRAKSKYYLQPFLPVNISCYGNSDLLTLTNIEPCGAGYQLKGQSLLTGIYVNELLLKLLRRHVAEPEIFSIYQAALNALHEAKNNLQLEESLRQFEYQILTILGYGFSWAHTANKQLPIQPNTYYAFDPQQGFLDLAELQGRQALVFPGTHLLAIDCSEFSDPAVLRSAKQIMRIAITALLDGATLRSRELFI